MSCIQRPCECAHWICTRSLVSNWRWWRWEPWCALTSSSVARVPVGETRTQWFAYEAQSTCMWKVNSWGEETLPSHNIWSHIPGWAGLSGQAAARRERCCWETPSPSSEPRLETDLVQTPTHTHTSAMFADHLDEKLMRLMRHEIISTSLQNRF